MEIEKVNDVEQDEKKIAKRLAILNMCLVANEEVESKPIYVQLMQIIEKNQITNQVHSVKINSQAEFFITNFRFLLIIYQKDGSYEERSIFYSVIEKFQIKVPNLSSTDSINFSQVIYDTDNNTVQVSMFFERISQPDQKKLNDQFTKQKTQLEGKGQPVPIEQIVKKQLLEKDKKLESFYQTVVNTKKILTEEQFWKNHEVYQNFLKFKQRDEEKIKRDYIEKEIPLIQKEFPFDISVDPMDERINKFDKFRKEIYDPLGQIENQNLKSFQSYKQDVYFYGQIDKEIIKIEQDKKKKDSQKMDEEIIHDETHHHHHLEIEEHSLETSHTNTKKSQTQEMKKEEYLLNLKQNPSADKQKKLEVFLATHLSTTNSKSYQKSQELLREFKEGDTKKLDPKSPEQKDAIKKVAKRVQDSWKQAFECIYKLKPLSQQAANSALAKRYNEVYYEKFYQLREILRWLYKEKNNGDRARPEVIEKLKSELDLIRNSLNEILRSLNDSDKKENTDDIAKKVNQQYKERIQDLVDSFIFKSSND